MDWTKIDTALAGALDHADAGECLGVFVHVDLAVCDPDEDLAALGGRGEVRTATVTVAQVADLTDQAWVRHLRWSGPLRLLDDDPTG